MRESSKLSALVSQKQSIETIVFRLEVLVVCFGILVVIGLVGETVSIDHAIATVFSICVDFGVAGEVIVGIFGLLKGNRLRSLQKTIDIETEKESKAIRLQLENHIIDLKSQLIEANKKLEQQEPRKLSEEQAREIGSALSVFAGQKVSVQCMLGDPDGINYAQRLVFALMGAKWSIGGLSHSSNFGDWGSAMVGVSKADADHPLSPAAVALALVLYRTGVTADPSQVYILDDLPSGELKLLVGFKPTSKPAAPQIASFPGTIRI